MDNPHIDEEFHDFQQAAQCLQMLHNRLVFSKISDISALDALPEEGLCPMAQSYNAALACLDQAAVHMQGAHYHYIQQNGHTPPTNRSRNGDCDASSQASVEVGR